MAIQDVVVVSVPVSDQQRAKAFYVDKLGFELQREDDSVPGLHWVQFDGPPQRRPWATETVLRDPDGNSLVLQQA